MKVNFFNKFILNLLASQVLKGVLFLELKKYLYKKLAEKSLFIKNQNK